MVYRIFVEKKDGFDVEAKNVKEELRELLSLDGLANVRIINRYDAEGITEELFDMAVRRVFSDPVSDRTFRDFEVPKGSRVLAVEYLPGQFDQRASSAAECIQLISEGERPVVRSAKIYVLDGIGEEEFARVKKMLINPVESREASLDLPETLALDYEEPDDVKVLDGFISYGEDELRRFSDENGLAMDLADLTFIRDHFAEEHRDPTITEIKVLDTYWSDHCRHTTFNTVIDSVKFEDPDVEEAYREYLKAREETGDRKPVTLMDCGTIAAKYLRSKGLLDKLDESEEINACTVKTDVTIDGKKEKWLLLFKNETHNHPTEIEPFGGAATCIGGAIRDPLSGRSYVYAAMRVTGAADPLKPVSETMKGKLPQSKIVTKAAEGYSSYGNQIGLTTGLVDEIYHPGYVAKRMEVGAVVAAAPENCVVRKRPVPGDAVILLGGKTGRDGMGGATGASKSHNVESLEECGAEVQKGNAPEERKLQRLFRNPEASRMIKRCNDFGAGGVSVAIGELADGLDVDLDKVPKKYNGLDGTELAISESQERMAVVTSEKDKERFLELAESENLEATEVAVVTEEPYLREYWRGKKIVDISRAFLDTDGVEKHVDIEIAPEESAPEKTPEGFREGFLKMANDLNCASKRGLSERFDSTIGAGTVTMPFGGARQRTPIQAMTHLISTEKGHTDDVSVMAYGFDPEVSKAGPFRGSYTAVVNSVAKLVAAGCSLDDTYLSFQEYFPHPGTAAKWGLPLAAVLGAFKAQKELQIAAIGGKDSMSGTFEDIDVPPTLISFAITTAKAGDIVTPEFKDVDDKVIMFIPMKDQIGLPESSSFRKIADRIREMTKQGAVKAIYTPGYGGVAEAVMKMAMGNDLGFDFCSGIKEETLFRKNYGSFLIELAQGADMPAAEDFDAIELGRVTDKHCFTLGTDFIDTKELFDVYENKLEPVYKCNIDDAEQADIETITYTGGAAAASTNCGAAEPKVFIPVFPGTNCEYDTAKAFRDAGAACDVGILNNLDKEHIERSVDDFAKRIRDAQMIFLPGGFSGGDEPDGSAKFITSVFRNPAVKDAVEDLLDRRGGLIAGICNGFQALIKLGLVPYGKIVDAEPDAPTLTFNTIGRHQSKLIRVRVASDLSPWMKHAEVGNVYLQPISHGEGRFAAPESTIRKLAENGQILTQYVDLNGEPTGLVQYNPNGSAFAIEGITSPDGRVLGKMGHAERIGKDLYKNVPGETDMQLFRSAVEFFR